MNRPGEGLRFRVRLLAGSVLLVGIAMIQSPGLLVPDTKLDLAVAPLDFLARAAHLWDAEGAFGQLQNQAYGYLWPMGPFFALGEVVGMPGWVVQRLWVALVLVVAFVGAACLSRALGVRSDLGCLIAGFAYALSPRMLTVLGPISIEAWPSALAPWVLLPLVIGATRGSPRRAAALAALAVAMVGGVNAAATSAVLPLGVLWLLTRGPGRRRRSMMLWWPIFTLLGTLWWLVPLFVMGAYSPPFLDFIESAASTTFPTTMFDSLRGTSNWVPYIDQGSRAGNDLLRLGHLPMNSGVVIVGGLVGLTLVRNPHRLFLVSGLVVGLLLVTMGHHGSVQGWFAPQLRDLLDGVLAPLRNVHKFDPLIRLPLVVGLAFLVDELRDRQRAGQAEGRGVARVGDRVNMGMLIGVVVLGVVGAALPAAFGRIAPAGGFVDVPGYWREAADWLAAEQDEGVALLVPGSSFGTYVWGTPEDEPMQSLARKPWAVRNAIPLAPAGNIRMLDEIEERLSQGAASDGLATYLRRAGVSHVVVRNDLVRSDEIPDPVLVHQALDGSRGLTRVATFGPEIGGDARIEGELGKAIVNGGWQAETPALEIYAVADPPSFATSPGSPDVVVGGPEDLLDLADLGLVDDASVRLAADLGEEERPSGRLLLTDGNRLVERNFGRLRDATSATKTVDDPVRLSRRVADYELPGGGRWVTVADYQGIRTVQASSSRSDADTLGAAQPGALPYAALDGSEATAWTSAPGAKEAPWWQVDLEHPRVLGRVEISVEPGERELLQVSTQEWTSGPLEFSPVDSTRSVVVPGAARWLRIEDVSGVTQNRMAIAEVDLGVVVRRKLVLPQVPEEWGTPDSIVLRRLRDERNGCALVEDAVRCNDREVVAEEEPYDFSREFALPSRADLPASLLARPRAGAALDRVLLRDQPVAITTSSAGVDDVRAGAVAAIDGDPATTWIASRGQVNPEVELTWLDERRIDGIGMSVSREVPARLPQSLELVWPGGVRTVELTNGRATFPPLRTSSLTIRVLEAEPATDIGFDGTARSVPVGISELVLQGLPYLPLALPEDAVQSACGIGPDVSINSRTYETRIAASAADLARRLAVPAQLCAQETDVPLRAGVNEVTVEASDAFVGDSLVLGEAPTATQVRPANSAASRRDSAVEREIDPLDDVTATRENFNPGWVDAAEGESAAPVLLDGWKQGWVTDSGGPVEAVFAPDAAYRRGLLGGALAVLALVVCAAWPLRRRDQAELVPATVPLPVAALAMVGVCGLLAGTPGAAVGGVGALGGWVLSRRAPVWGGAWLAAPVVVTAFAYVLRPWGSSAGWAGSLAWAQLLVVLAVSGVVAWVAATSPPRQRRGSRVAGISTRR